MVGRGREKAVCWPGSVKVCAVERSRKKSERKLIKEKEA
jgi:hypothetical protein